LSDSGIPIARVRAGQSCSDGFMGDLCAVVASLAELGPVRPITADLSTAEGAAGLAARLADFEDTVHALFNNAGTAWEESFEDFPQSGFDKVLAINVTGVFFVTRAMLPFLRAAATREDPARVINTGSLDGIRTPLRGRNNFSYSASKAPVHMLTCHLAGELAPTILVNPTAPGPYESRMTAKLMAAGGEAVEQYVPLGRIGRPDDMAAMSVLLASRASSWITVCHWCGRWLNPDIKWPHPHSASVDHLVPVSRGGDSAGGELVASCLGCNRSRGNRLGPPRPKAEEARAVDFCCRIRRGGSIRDVGEETAGRCPGGGTPSGWPVASQA
jgi:NAD(P)-dependent dehydrogenase (short-subunit alcohol dehydrogenase family)